MGRGIDRCAAVCRAHEPLTRRAEDRPVKSIRLGLAAVAFGVPLALPLVAALVTVAV